MPLPARHVSTALPALLRYLTPLRPPLLLTDKDRVNRLALLAAALAGGHTPRGGAPWHYRVGEPRPPRRRRARRAAPVDAPPVPARSDRAGALAGRGGRSGRVRRAAARNASRVVPSPVLTGDPSGSHGAAAAGRGPGPRISPPTVLGIGELCARKDFATLIRAFAGLRAARALPAGDPRRGPPARRGSKRWCASLASAADVQLPGFVANPYPHLARAALFVLASRCEGLPVALIEALACGAPVVSTDCPSGPRELLQDGRLGPLVPVGDVERAWSGHGRRRSPPRRRRCAAHGAAAPYAAQRRPAPTSTALGRAAPVALA